MNQNMAHANDVIPGNLVVLFLKFQRKHEGGLADYLYVFDNRKKAELIYGQLVLGIPFCKRDYMIGGSNDIL